MMLISSLKHCKELIVKNITLAEREEFGSGTFSFSSYVL